MEKITVKNIPKKKHVKEDVHKARRGIAKALKSRNFLNIVLLALLFFVIVTGIGLIYLNSVSVAVTENTPSWIKSVVELNDRLFKKKVELAAVVNGEAIPLSELDERYRLLPPQYQGAVTKEQLLGQLIDETMLLQDAVKKGVSASDQEVDDKLLEILKENMLTLENFTATITEKNLTVDKVKQYYKREIILTKLLNETVLTKANATESEIEEFYNNNTDLYKFPQSANVSHILICFNESIRCVSNLTKEEAFKSASDVRSKIVSGMSFVDAVANYSEDPSRIFNAGNLGFISKEDPFDPDFINATFALAPRNISQPVLTQFGYHLILVDSFRDAGTLGLDELKSQIGEQLTFEKQKAKFAEYMSELRAASVISNFVQSPKGQQ